MLVVLAWHFKIVHSTILIHVLIVHLSLGVNKTRHLYPLFFQQNGKR